MTFDERFDTSASPEQAFPYLSDFKNLPAWDSTVSKVDQLLPGPVGLGTKFAVTIVMYGVANQLDYHVENYEPDRRAVLIGAGSTVTVTDTIVVTSRGKGSRVQWKAEIKLWGPLQLADPLAKLFLRSSVKQACANLKRVLDAL